MKLQPQFLKINWNRFKNASHSLRVIFSATEIEVIVRNHIKYNEKTRNKINMSGNMEKKTFLIPAIFFRENWSHALFMILSVLFYVFFLFEMCINAHLSNRHWEQKYCEISLVFHVKKAIRNTVWYFFGCSYLHN